MSAFKRSHDLVDDIFAIAPELDGRTATRRPALRAGEWAPIGTPLAAHSGPPMALQDDPENPETRSESGFPERARQDSNLRLLPPENSRRNTLRNAQSALQSQIPAHRGRTGSRASRPDSAQFGAVWAPVPKRVPVWPGVQRERGGAPSRVGSWPALVKNAQRGPRGWGPL